MRRPDFIIIGTQKAGTTWVEHQLNALPDVMTPQRQLHYFDQHFDKGIGWYTDQFHHCTSRVIGEKTTEYFDPAHLPDVAQRMCREVPDTKLILVLRDPVKRAMSALEHMVNSGLVPRPKDPNAALWADEGGYRYVARGEYAPQIAAFDAAFSRNQLLILILEEDIQKNPDQGWQKLCNFLELAPATRPNLEERVNTLRLSQTGAWLSHKLYNIPRARGVIRRLDHFLGLPSWRPVYTKETKNRLAAHYAPVNDTLFDRIGYKIDTWTTPYAP